MKKLNTVAYSKDLAYWIGVAQSDGCLTSYKTKRSDRIGKTETRIELALQVCSKSLLMLEKFRDISETIFNRRYKICKASNKDVWVFHICVKSLLQLFGELDINLSSPFFIPPNWVEQDIGYFGAYLSGLIDGDGCIDIKRPEYPQCAIQISGSWQDILTKNITKLLICGVHQSKSHRIFFSKTLNRVIEGTTYVLEFYVSLKTAKFILDFVIPNL